MLDTFVTIMAMTIGWGPLVWCDLRVPYSWQICFCGGASNCHELKRPQTCTMWLLRLGVVLLEYVYKRMNASSDLLHMFSWWMQPVMLANSTEPGLPIGWQPECLRTSHHLLGHLGWGTACLRDKSSKFWVIIAGECICLSIFYSRNVSCCGCKGKMCLQKKHRPQHVG